MPEEVCRQLGRWRPSIDEGYERNARANVLRSQLLMAQFIKTNKGRMDPLDEELVLKQLLVQLENHGHLDRTEQVIFLRTFARPCEVAEPNPR